MNQYVVKPMKQLELLEGGIEMKIQPAKRVNIVDKVFENQKNWGRFSLFPQFYPNLIVSRIMVVL